jgi:hypothetical protein
MGAGSLLCVALALGLAYLLWLLRGLEARVRRLEHAAAESGAQPLLNVLLRPARPTPQPGPTIEEATEDEAPDE